MGYGMAVMSSENHAREIKFMAARKIGELKPAAPPDDRGQGRSGKKINSHKENDLQLSPKKLTEFRKLAEELSGKVENLLFVIWVQDQRHEYWMKFIREIREEIEKDGQEAGEMLLDIEARSGELSEDIQLEGDVSKRPYSPPGRLKESGLNFRRTHQARAISKHPEIVEKVKAQARDCREEIIKTRNEDRFNF
jgi:hypothetical protein